MALKQMADAAAESSRTWPSTTASGQGSVVAIQFRTERGGQERLKESGRGHQASGITTFGKGPAEYFTGSVRIDSLIDAAAPARARGASVTFEPGRSDGVAHASAGARRSS